MADNIGAPTLRRRTLRHREAGAPESHHSTGPAIPFQLASFPSNSCRPSPVKTPAPTQYRRKSTGRGRRGPRNGRCVPTPYLLAPYHITADATFFHATLARCDSVSLPRTFECSV